MTALGDILRLIRVEGEQTGYFMKPTGKPFFTDEPDVELDQTTNVWFSLNPGTDGGFGRVTSESVTRLAALHADLDIGGAGKSMPDAESARAVVMDLSQMLGSHPVAVISSGHGYQPIWGIDPADLHGDEATALLRRWGALVRKVAAARGGEVDSVFDLARLVRAPGSVNYKAQPVRASATMTGGRLLTVNEVRETLEAFAPIVSEPVSAPAPASSAEKPATSTPYEQNIVEAELARLKALQRPWASGAGWDQTVYEVACVLTQIANSPWAALTHDRVEDLLDDHAPHDDAWGGREIGEKIASARRSVGDKTRPAPAQKIDDSGLFRGASQVTATSAQVISHDLSVDVSNPALAAKWLREEVGTGPLSGIFYRKGELVYTPRVGEAGYIEPRNAIAEGAASITVMGESDLRARVQHRYHVTRLVKVDSTFKEKDAIFPIEAAQIIVRAPDDAPHLRELVGVVHTPTFRTDGSLITRPGYDVDTGLLFLPTGGQPGHVPDVPSSADVQRAVTTLDFMLQDFRFVTPGDRATYLGYLMTPLLRTLVPPPYKLGVIEAHQPGSGKSFLARAITTIHGGVMHAEMPTDDAEFAKVVGAILDTQTSPVVAFDNVTGLVRSPTLAGLLTSPTFQGRRLGSSTVIEQANDRLWIITGNNAALGGDLARRNARIRIDPGVPNPEARTEFVIANFEHWVREHRGDLLWALLVLVRHWIVQGGAFVDTPTGDSYGRWASTVRGILWSAGIQGLFDDPATREISTDPDSEEWGSFLTTVEGIMGTNVWTAKSLLGLVQHPSVMISDPSKPIPFDALPADLLRGRNAADPAILSKSLGRWLMNRQGRWYNDLTVRVSGMDRSHAKTWRIFRYGA